MVQCLYCGKDFSPNSKGSGGTNRICCFECLPEGLSKTERTKIYYSLNVEKARKEKKDLGCSSCGYNKNASALEWHHPDIEKGTEPSNALKRGWKGYKKEIEGCILLCANCHREIHFPEN